MFASNDRCCFRRLGIERNSTERVIKRAFRKLCRETHPDMYSDPADKVRAAAAFRELYETYEEALGAAAVARDPKRASASSGPNFRRSNARSANDSDIRKVYQDVCDELDRNLADGERARMSEVERSVKEAWPDREKTWNILRREFPWQVNKLVRLFAGGPTDDISKFLEGKAEEAQTESMRNFWLQRVEWARYVDDHWPDTAHLKSWTQATMTLCDYTNVAGRVTNPLAAAMLKKWGDKLLMESNKGIRLQLQQSAAAIVRAYPDRGAIMTIVQRHIVNRRALYDLLPESIRLALMGANFLTGS